MKPKFNQFLPLAAAVVALSPMTTTLGAEKPNVDTSHSQSVTSLGLLTIGGLPTDIQTVINNINAYKLVEEGKLVTFETAETAAATAVTAKEVEIDAKELQIQNLIAANPLDPNIAIQQANLATLQGQLPALQTTLVNAQADVQNSEIKIALYQQCIDSPIADAQDAAEAAAVPLNKAVDQYKAGGDKDATNYAATGNSGLQSVLDAVKVVTAGDQAPVTTAIKTADTTFAAIGAANATVADIQALVGVIDTQLPTLPPISSADKTTVLETVLNGSYERNAIDLNTTDIAANEQAITAETTRATTAEGVLDGKITAEEARAIAAEVALDGKITAEEVRAIAAEGVLDGKITTEVADRIADVNAEENRAKAAEGVLDGKITQEVADRTALIRNVGGKIHIGQNSLVTSEAGGFQELSAQTVGGGSIDINVTNGSDLRVNGVSVATDADVASEANARTIADTLIRTDFAAADSTERNARIAADDSIRNEFQAADRNLRSDIDTNTRGIAMVAAMTNTTIQPGMNHGVDFNISQFESETGFAFGYAHRINENMQVHGSAASTTDFDESVGRLGVSFQW